MSAFDIERAKKTPSSAFASPKDVVEHPDLTEDDKLEILMRWKYEALQLEVAQGENMWANEDSQLRDVLNAIHALQASNESR